MVIGCFRHIAQGILNLFAIIMGSGIVVSGYRTPLVCLGLGKPFNFDITFCRIIFVLCHIPQGIFFLHKFNAVIIIGMCSFITSLVRFRHQVAVCIIFHGGSVACRISNTDRISMFVVFRYRLILVFVNRRFTYGNFVVSPVIFISLPYFVSVPFYRNVDPFITVFIIIFIFILCLTAQGIPFNDRFQVLVECSFALLAITVNHISGTDTL